MKIRVIAACSALLLLAACGSATPNPSKTSSASVSSSSPTASSTPTPSDTFSPPPIEVKSWITSVDKVVAGNKYWDNFTYPYFSTTHSDNAAVKRIVRNLNVEMNDFLRSFMDRAKKEFAKANAQDWVPAAMNLTGIQEIGSQNLLFVRMEHYETYYDQAHGGGATWTDVFDLRTGELLNLKNQINRDRQDVFITLVADTLLSQVGQEALDDKQSMIDQLSDWNDFICWSVTNEGMSITFNEYVVGPYASGTPAISIPWNSLITIINNKSVIGEEFAAQLNSKNS